MTVSVSRVSIVLLVMCCFYDGISQDCTTIETVSGVSNSSTADNSTSARGSVRRRLCTCRKYRCSCCVNFSFIERWPALGCLNIQSLPGNLNIVLSFSFNRRRMAVFPIAGSRPMPFCKQLGLGTAMGCLVIYNVRTDTPHDVTICLYMELRVGVHCVATIHLDCIRKIRRHIQFIPIPSHTRKLNSQSKLSEKVSLYKLCRGCKVPGVPRRDLTVCDFFLWGYLKEQANIRTFNNDEGLKQSIEEELLWIPQNFFVRAYDSFVTRCYQCVAVDD
ncbi:hypothetical protein J6590_089380 [Homalodisca vitripennis]|nr:hypothetical protein J6590_089380 [Homalodisca vitripennis]